MSGSNVGYQLSKKYQLPEAIPLPNLIYRPQLRDYTPQGHRREATRPYKPFVILDGQWLDIKQSPILLANSYLCL